MGFQPCAILPLFYEKFGTLAMIKHEARYGYSEASDKFTSPWVSSVKLECLIKTTYDNHLISRAC